MSSKLIITPVENWKEKKVEIVKSFSIPGVYVSLNKSVWSVKNILEKNKISSKKLFFIDCVSSKKINEDVLHISPNELDKLEYAIKSFIKEIKNKKFLIIDALSTLLIYNSENRVAGFIKEIINYANEYETEVIALTPKTKGEELLNKIFNFFDVVKGK